MFVDRRIFLNHQRIFYLLIVSLFICIGIYNYRYVERNRKNEYEVIIEQEFKLLLFNLSQQTTTPSTADRFKERRNLLIQKCQEYHLIGDNGTKREPNAWEFLINNKYELVWCNVFKAGSTSWFYNFNLLAGYNKSFLDTTRETPVSVARRKYPRPSVQELNIALQTHLSFIIVREPFEKLVSAYRDKFGSPYNQYFRPLGEQMIKAAMKIGVSGETYPPTFEQFINFIVCQWELGIKLNEHWTPTYSLCSPCQVFFDLILHVETLNRDQEYLIKEASLEDIIEPTWKNSAKNKTDDIIEEYFYDIDENLITRLLIMFRFDFELFGYSTEKYKDLGSDPEDEINLQCPPKEFLIE